MAVVPLLATTTESPTINAFGSVVLMVAVVLDPADGETFDPEATGEPCAFSDATGTVPVIANVPFALVSAPVTVTESDVVKTCG